MSLDDKLREILGLVLHADLKSDLIDSMVASIKQAFTNEGWVELRLAEVRPWKETVKNLNELTGSDVSLTEAYKQNLMTGQEWYDRFEREIGEWGLGAYSVEYRRVKLDSVLEAAKKAAGL